MLRNGTPIDLLVKARWVIPVEPDDSVLEHWAVAVDGRQIAAVGAAGELSARFAPRETIELPSHVLLPGLVNVHTHAAMTLLRGFADDLPLMQWLNEHIWPAEARWVNRDFVNAGTGLAVAEMIRGGTTCFADMYFFPDVVAQVAERSGMRACVGLILIDFPTAWASDAEEYLHKGIALHDEVRHSPLVTTAFAPHSPYTVSDGAFRKMRVLADELDIPVQMHVHETAHEVEESLARHGMRPLERIEALGLLTPRLIAVHMTQLLPAEIEKLAINGVNVAHCPESNLKLASGMCPVRDLSAAGVNVALGTDGAASNNDLDMLGEVRTAALLAKGVSGDPTAVPAAEALRMATVNGARALGLEAVTGSLVAGKEADMIAVDLGHPAAQPVYHVASQVAYGTSRDQVSDVWIAGRRVLRDRRLTTLDSDSLRAQAESWRERIAGGVASGDGSSAEYVGKI